MRGLHSFAELQKDGFEGKGREEDERVGEGLGCEKVVGCRWGRSEKNLRALYSNTQ
jgi:hypothetical protein